MAAENKSLGRFVLDGILPAPRGVPQVEVTFDIDANGILNVSAKDKGTGKEQRITITGSSGLNKEEVDKLVKEAELHAEEDRRKREEVETRNLADNLVYSTEKLLRDNADKIPDDLKQEIDGKISAVREALQGQDGNRIRSAVQDLQASVQKAGEAVYSQTGSGDPQPGAGPGPEDTTGGDENPPEETVEGEYREV